VVSITGAGGNGGTGGNGGFCAFAGKGGGGGTVFFVCEKLADAHNKQAINKLALNSFIIIFVL
jgi:hypothetical protein